MLNRRSVIALALMAACKIPDVSFTRAGDAGGVIGDAGIVIGDTGIVVGDPGDAGPMRCAQLGFPSVPWPKLGAGSRAVAVTDVSGDRKPDVMVTNEDSNTVSVLIGNGNGTFQARVDYPTGMRPVALVVADMNGDGKPDLVTANKNGSTVSVFVGNGNGTFQAKVDYVTGLNPSSVAISDVNGDGKPDLIVANESAFTLSVLIGRGDGTFRRRSTIRVARRRRSQRRT